MTNNITKIEEILKNLVVVIKLGEIKAVPPSEVENVRESVVKELQALIEKREREAVEGFAKWVGGPGEWIEEYFEGGKPDEISDKVETPNTNELWWDKEGNRVPTPDRGGTPKESTPKERFEERFGYIWMAKDPKKYIRDDEGERLWNYHTSEILSILDELEKHFDKVAWEDDSVLNSDSVVKDDIDNKLDEIRGRYG